MILDESWRTVIRFIVVLRGSILVISREILHYPNGSDLQAIITLLSQRREK